MMNKVIIPFWLMILGCACMQGQSELLPCSSDAWHTHQEEIYPELTLLEARLEERIQRQQASSANARTGEVITIPVVVHVLYHEDDENIPDLQIFSQLEVLNEDFRLLNENVRYIPSAFQSIAADTEIEFCLASLNPAGLPATGITRTYTQYDCIGDVFTIESQGKSRLFYTDLGGQDAWDTEQYLNIWVANSCGAVLGLTPSVALSEMLPEEDGVVLDFTIFGNNCESSHAAPYHLGRTATHEIGHYLGLEHPWSSCEDVLGDGVEDTPQQSAPYYGCPSYPQASCGSEDIHMNFMNYTDDACMSMFTAGQRDRMLAVLADTRLGLTTSVGCAWLPPTEPFENDAITIYPNPTEDCIHIDFNAEIGGDVDVELTDAAGRVVYRIIESARNFRSINTTNLSRGVYFLSFRAGKQTITKKIIVK